MKVNLNYLNSNQYKLLRYIYLANQYKYIDRLWEQVPI